MAREQQATEASKGIIQLASDADVISGIDNTKAITPIKLKNNLLTRSFSDGVYGRLFFDPKTVSGLQVWYDAVNVTLGTSPLVSQITDLSGNNNHMVQATTTAQPSKAFYGGGDGLPYISFVSGKNVLLSTLALTQPFTVYLVVRQNTLVNQGNIITFNTSTNGVAQIAAQTSIFNALTLVSGVNWAPANVPNYYKNDFALYSMVFNGGSSTLAINKEIPLVGNPGTAATVKLQLGAGTNFDFQELLIYSGAIGATNDQLIKGYLCERYQLVNYDYLQSFGDSITAGSTGVSNPTKLAWPALVAVERVKNLYNQGTPGATFQNLVTDIKKMDYANNGWVTIMYGTNQYDETASKAILRSAVAKLLRHGFPKNKVILMTPPYSSAKTWLPSLNLRIQEVVAEFQTSFVDIYTATQNAGGDSLLVDGTHPNDTGHRIMADAVKAVIV